MLESPPAIVEHTAPAEQLAANYDFGGHEPTPVRLEALVAGSQPISAPEKPNHTPESVPAEVALTTQAPKGFWNRLKAKWWK
jgi:hypothetical protein